MSRSRLGKRILLAFAGVIGIALAGGAVIFSSIAGLSQSVRSVAELSFPGARALADIDRALQQSTRGMNGILSERILADPGMHDAVFQLAEEGLATVADGRRRFEVLPHHAEDAEAWRALAPGLDRWSEATRAFLEMARERDRASGAAKDGLEERQWSRYREVRAAYVGIADPLRALEKAIDRDVEDQRVEAAAASARGVRLVVVVVALAALFGTAIALRIVRGLDRGLRAVQDEMGRLRHAVADGKLDVRGAADGVEPDFRPIVEGFNETLDAAARPIRVASEALARIAAGDPPPPLEHAYRGDFDLIRRNLNTCIATLAALDADARGLVDAAVAGRLDHRADAARHPGAFGRLVGGMNTLLGTLVAHIDAMPAPAFIVDREFRVQYLNAAACEASGASAATARGRRCSELFVAGDCGTERCACMRAMRDGRAASSDTTARCGGKELEIAYSGVPVRDLQGRVVGAFEVISDQTAVRRAMRAGAKLSEYQRAEADRLVAALAKLSRGELDVQVRVAEGDADTAGARAQFDAIAKALTASADAVTAVMRDADGLARAALAGKLSTRADATRHSGEFRKIVDGMNRMVDAVLAPIAEARQVLQRIADRDLRARVEGRYDGEHARIQEAVNATAESLQRALGQVSDTVHQVSSAAAQIASSSQSVASGASEQASALEETGSALDSVSATAKQAADSAHEANLLAQTARTAAQDGAAAVEGLQGAMAQIKASADGTSQIIKDVSEIAFQTNLLALNAAVEAARAGEAGRGFAVVAEEVRSLALRAKEAAQKTEALIRGSVKQAQDGAASAAHVAGKLAEIQGVVSKVTDIVAEIAASAKEQSAGVAQVSTAVSEMDKVTQQNAASAEQSSSAASELSSQAEALATMVSAFHLSDRAATPPPRPPPRPAPQRAPAPPAAAPPRTARNGKANGAAHDPFPMDDDVSLKDF